MSKNSGKYPTVMNSNKNLSHMEQGNNLIKRASRINDLHKDQDKRFKQSVVIAKQKGKKGNIKKTNQPKGDILTTISGQEFESILTVMPTDQYDHIPGEKQQEQQKQQHKYQRKQQEKQQQSIINQQSLKQMLKSKKICDVVQQLYGANSDDQKGQLLICRKGYSQERDHHHQGCHEILRQAIKDRNNQQNNYIINNDNNKKFVIARTDSIMEQQQHYQQLLQNNLNDNNRNVNRKDNRNVNRKDNNNDSNYTKINNNINNNGIMLINLYDRMTQFNTKISTINSLTTIKANNIKHMQNDKIKESEISTLKQQVKRYKMMYHDMVTENAQLIVQNKSLKDQNTSFKILIDQHDKIKNNMQAKIIQQQKTYQTLFTTYQEKQIQSFQIKKQLLNQNKQLKYQTETINCQNKNLRIQLDKRVDIIQYKCIELNKLQQQIRKYSNILININKDLFINCQQLSPSNNNSINNSNNIYYQHQQILAYDNSLSQIQNLKNIVLTVHKNKYNIITRYDDLVTTINKQYNNIITQNNNNTNTAANNNYSNQSCTSMLQKIIKKTKYNSQSYQQYYNYIQREISAIIYEITRYLLKKGLHKVQHNQSSQLCNQYNRMYQANKLIEQLKDGIQKLQQIK